MVSSEEHNEAITSHDETITSTSQQDNSTSASDMQRDLVLLLSMLRLPPDLGNSLSQLLNGDCSVSQLDEELISLVTKELHAALLESSKSCLGLACPMLIHFCQTVRKVWTLTEPSNCDKLAAEFCASVLLELMPGIVVAAFLFGSTSHSLLESASTTSNVVLASLHSVAPIQASVPPSPTVTGNVQLASSPPLRHILSTTLAPSHGHISNAANSPEFLLQFVLWLLSNGALSRFAGSTFPVQSSSGQGLLRQSAASMSTSMLLRPASAASNAGRTNVPGSPPLLSGQTQQNNTNGSMPAVHHFASLVAPSVYHNPVLFGASAISDSAQTEHHQRERRVRIQTAQLIAPISSLIASFDANGPSTLPTGMVAPLAMSILAEFNRLNAIQLSWTPVNIPAVIRSCDAALRLLVLPISSPSLQAVSSGLVLQFVYFVSIAAAGAVRSLIKSCENVNLCSPTIVSAQTASTSPVTSKDNQPTKGCRKCSTSSNHKAASKIGGVSFDFEGTVDEADSVSNDDDEDNEVADDKQLCRLKLLQVLHASRNLAELRLWPDVLAVVKAVRNTSGLVVELGDGYASGNIESAFAQPTTVRAITNASFKAKKLADDIEVLGADQKELISSPGTKRVHGHHPAQQHDLKEGETNAPLSASNPFASQWKSGKHSAAIASLQAAFRLPERLRSRRRSFGHEMGSNSGSSLHQQTLPTGGNNSLNAATSTMAQTTPTSQRSQTATEKPVLTAATSFNFGDGEGVPSSPVGPRLEMRILNTSNQPSSSIGLDELETALDEHHPDLPMIDDNNNNRNIGVGASGGSSNNSDHNTPRSRANSNAQRPATITSTLTSLTGRTNRS